MWTRVDGVPDWLDAGRLLGPGDWRPHGASLVADLPPNDAADVGARLRGVVLGGVALRVSTDPPLPRARVRAARLQDARRRRELTPGFTRPGAHTDDEGRWSLTPESLALALGRRAGPVTVFDACGGCGGNAIGFARAGGRVVCVESDAARLAMARRNAAIYGVTDRIHFVHGRAEEHVAAADLWFVDPPWRDPAAPTLASLAPLEALLARPHPELWLKAPAAFDPATLPGATAEAWFGDAEGDRRRVKFLILRHPPS